MTGKAHDATDTNGPNGPTTSSAPGLNQAPGIGEAEAPGGVSAREAARASQRAQAQMLESLWEGVEAVVHGSHLFRSLDVDARRELVDRGHVMLFPSGQVILQEGDPGEGFYLVDSGVVEVNTVGPTGVPVALATLQRGGFFGEVAMLTGMPRTATVTALTDVCVVRFDKQDIDEVLDRNPGARRLLEAMIAGRARDTMEKVLRASGFPEDE